MTDALGEAIVEELALLHERLRKSVEGLEGAQLDRALGPETNSIAVLVTHTCQSELDWLHTAAGRTMSRDREAEFKTAGRSADDLRATVERAQSQVPDLVRAAIAAGLDAKRSSRGGPERTAAYCIEHALKHTAEHVGQIELTRQLVTRP